MINEVQALNGSVYSNSELKGTLSSSTVKVYPELEDIEITPTNSDQKFKSENYYGYNEVIVKGVEGAKEDLDEVLNEQNNLITEQEVTIEDIIEAIDKKMMDEEVIFKVENQTLILSKGVVEGGALSL